MENILSMRELLTAGVHFGHLTSRWNPRMKPYIYGPRNGIHVINLEKTVPALNAACAFVEEVTASGGHILFVGTKKQAQDILEEEAKRSGMFYITHRWLGGMLTNFSTIQARVRYMKQVEEQQESGQLDTLTKKELKKQLDELTKLQNIFNGIRNMRRIPDAIFIVDTKKERTAVLEGRRLEIPIIALADTNCDPDEMEYPIPANDDAIRAIRLLTTVIADAAIRGRQQYEAQRKDRETPARHEQAQSAESVENENSVVQVAETIETETVAS